MARLRLGEILIKQGLITEAQLKEVIEAQKTEKEHIGELLLSKGMIKEEELATALGQQLLIPYAAKSSGLLTPQKDQRLEKMISFEYAKEHLILPLSKNMNSLTCAIFNPFDLIVIDNVKKMTNCEVNLVIATKSDLAKAINEFYSTNESARSQMWGNAVEKSSVMSEQDRLDAAADDKGESELSLDKIIARAEEAPVIKLVDLIIRQAIDEKASDIHIELFKDKLDVRYRIDGELYQIPPPAKHLHSPIVSRVKILAAMDIAEKRLPQDGRISVRLEGDRTVDLRVSTLPCVWGEKVVMRILDRDAIKLDLSLLGFEPKQLELLRRALKTPYGLFFVTGPTGSGKSTTLYSCLKEVMDPSKNIMTAEDPVEFRIDGINQVHVRPDIGFTFAEALRSFLRQDPDIVMVGEVRDLETAQICVRAALTGHFVLSTLHTSDAPSAITRLMDIGIAPYLLTPTLTMVVAQRLGRKLCPNCKEAYEPKLEELGEIKINADLIYRPKGCNMCSHTGYRGRVVISELVHVDDEMRRLISKQATYVEIRDAARANGMMTMFETGLRKVENGVTSLEEVMGVCVV